MRADRSDGMLGCTAAANRACPQAAFIIDFAVAIKSVGVAISYLVVIGDTMPTAMVHVADAALRSACRCALTLSRRR